MGASFQPEVYPYKETGSFRFWCQKVLPLVYDDSLSYYELLCKVVKYLNDVIANVDGLHDDVLSTNEAFANLQDFCNNYFDSTDFQSKIDEKLDVMAEDGTLTSLISPLVAENIGGVVAEQIGDVVGEQIGGTVASQIGDVVAEQIGEPASEATTAWLNANVDPVGSAVTVDKSLLIDGSAADSAVVGKNFDSVKSDIEFLGNLSPISLTDSKVLAVYSSGTTSLTPASNSHFKNAVVECNAGDKFLVSGSNSFDGDDTYIYTIYAFLGAFDGENYPLLSSRQVTNSELSDALITAPANAKYLVINTNIENPSYCYSLKALENCIRQPIIYQGTVGATDDIDDYLWRGYWLIPQSVVTGMINNNILPPIKPDVCFLLVLAIDTPSTYGYGSMQILLSAHNDTIIRYKTSQGWSNWSYKVPYVDYILTDSVGALMKVAESHFNEAYDSGSNIVYQARHGSGLFYPSAFYVYDGTEGADNAEFEGKPCTNCSQFITTLMKGVSYENSRYISGDDSGNKYSEWSWFSDGTGTYPSAGLMPLASDADSMPAADMYAYALAHGWSSLVVKNEGVVDICNIQIGDFIFTGHSDDDDPSDIGHIGMVVHVGRDSKTVQVIEGYKVTKVDDGGEAGMRLHTYDWADLIAYAKFPIACSDYVATKLYESDSVINKPADPSGTNVVTAITSLYDWSSGFYTVKLKGEFNSSNVAIPYISYTNDNSHYATQDFSRNGDEYVCTFHVTDDVVRININANKAYDRKITHMELYKGYVK